MTPERCPYCKGEGLTKHIARLYDGVIINPCMDCDGKGVRCSRCSKPQSQCECATEPVKPRKKG